MSGREVSSQVPTFQNVQELCVYLKKLVGKRSTRIQTERISEEEFRDSVGVLFSDRQNQEMFFKADGYCRTADNVLRRSRLRVIFDALKEYDAISYGDLEVR